MNRNITICGYTWEEGKGSEECAENPYETSGKFLEPTSAATCHVEHLLKVCASGQEKASGCCKNGAASHAHIRHLRQLLPRAMEDNVRERAKDE
jgi:hypothetical protein